MALKQRASILVSYAALALAHQTTANVELPVVGDYFAYSLSAPTLTVAPSDSSFSFSPYNWNRTAAAATTANAGAYFRVLFTGRTASLSFDVSAMVTPPTQIYWRIDDGPATAAPVAPSVKLVIPPSLVGNADVPYHYLEVVVKSTTETQNRWAAAGPSTRVAFTGLVLDATAAVAAALLAPRNILVYGDSITEGVRTLGESEPADTDRNSATLCWSYRLGALLGAEVGVIGFGASGITRGGSGGVPALPDSFNQQWAGVPRSFSPQPDLIVFNEGTNDGASNTVDAMTTVLNALLVLAPGTPIGVLRPFNGAQAANLQAAIAASRTPALSTYIDTEGFFNVSFGADALNLHPSGPNDIGRIAPRVAAALAPLLLQPLRR